MPGIDKALESGTFAESVATLLEREGDLCCRLFYASFARCIACYHPAELPPA
jgi:hypothetical protein